MQSVKLHGNSKSVNVRMFTYLFIQQLPLMRFTICSSDLFLLRHTIHREHYTNSRTKLSEFPSSSFVGDISFLLCTQRQCCVAHITYLRT